MRPVLEHVMQAELNLARWRTYRTDQAPGTVINTVVGVSVAGNIEDVEEIRPEAEYVALFPQVEVLEQGHVDLPITRGTLRAVTSSSKGIGSRYSISADTVIGAGRILGIWQAWLR